MAYKPRHLMTLFLPALLLAGFAVSCTDTDVLPDAGTPSIDFGTPALTRGVVTSDADMDVFDVWGWYKPTEGSETATDTQVFNATPVTKKGDSWKCNNPQRWQSGNTYRFYAVYPSFGATNKGYESASYDKDGNLTITNFDCTQGVDLMTASQNCVADDMIAHKQSVKFSFEHLLAYINVIVISEGDAVSVSDVKLYGINHIGNLNESVWQLSEPSTKDNPSFTSTGLSILENDTHEYSIWVDNLLLLPETTLESVFLEFDYQYSGDTEIKHSVIPLKTGNVAKWDANTRYNYRINIPQNSVDVELTVTVTDWVKKDYTVIW